MVNKYLACEYNWKLIKRVLESSEYIKHHTLKGVKKIENNTESLKKTS